MARQVVLAIVLLGLSGSALLAQGTARDRDDDDPLRTRLQLGLAVKSTLTPGAKTSSALAPDVVWRWRGKGSRTDARWGPSFGLGSLRSQVSSQLGATTLPVGDLRQRPLMVGMGYTMPRGRWQWTVGASIGWALNRINTPPPYLHRAAQAAGASDLWVDIDNSLAWGPQVKGWYDLNRRASFMVESAYVMTRPTFDLRANGRVTTTRLNADTLIVKMGVVYGVF